MITGGYFKCLDYMFKINWLYCASPYEWDAEKSLMKFVDGRKRSILYRVLLVVATLHWTGITVQLMIQRHNYPSPMVVAQFCWIVGFWTVVTSHLAGFGKRHEVLTLVNFLIAFERRHFGTSELKATWGKGDAKAKLLMHWYAFNCFTCPAAYGFLILTRACSVPFWGWQIVPCRPDPIFLQSLTSLVLGLIVALPQMAIMSYMTTSIFYNIHVYTISVKCISTYTQYIQSLSANGKSSSPRMKKIQDAFREVQVISTLHNECFRSALTPIAAFGWTLDSILTLYTTLKLNTKIPMPGFLLTPQVFLDGMLILGVGIRAGGVMHLTCVELFQNWKTCKMYRANNGFRKFVKSSAPIKALFGSCNYIDGLTSLIFIDFVINQTISIMIMFP